MSTGYQIRDQSGIHFVTFTVTEWIDVFTRNIYSDILVGSLEFCQKEKGLILYAWCIMSNHVHLIIAAKGNNLSDVVRDFKKFTSQSIINEIEQNTRESRKNWILWLLESAGKKNPKNVKYQFWKRDNRPKQLITPAFMKLKLDYTHNNPVKAGIVESPHEYIYSSARNYAGLSGLLDVEFLM